MTITQELMRLISTARNETGKNPVILRIARNDWLTLCDELHQDNFETAEEWNARFKTGIVGTFYGIPLKVVDDDPA